MSSRYTIGARSRYRRRILARGGFGMLATMMDYPLTLTHFVRRAKIYFGQNAIITRRCDKSLERSDYASLVQNAERLAKALAKLGVKPGDRVGTLAWNHRRHFELYLA